MRIRIVNGRVSAEAETAQDIQALLSYASKTPRAIRKGGKHKKKCPKCGTRVKYLDSHDTVMHGKGRLLGSVRGDLAKA